MQRRTFLFSTGFVLIGGCTAMTSNEPDSPDDNTSNESSEQRDTSDSPTDDATPMPYESGYFIVGKWVNNHPDDVDPNPTDEEPLKSNDTLQNFFDDVVALQMKPGTEDGPSNGASKTITSEVSEERSEEIVEDLQVVDYSHDSWKPGRYVDHEGTYIWLTVEEV